MARVEAMEPHRAALTAIARDSARPSWDGLVFASHFPRTARAILVGAGLDATPPRVVAMTAVWARIARVWRDDEGALNRTMAEIDKQFENHARPPGADRRGILEASISARRPSGPGSSHCHRLQRQTSVIANKSLDPGFRRGRRLGLSGARPIPC